MDQTPGVMRRLLLLLVPWLLMACSVDPSAPDQSDFQSYRVGNWMISSPSNAVWVGSSNNADTNTSSMDTLTLSSPDGRQLSITDGGEYNTKRGNILHFSILYIDSTITKKDSVDITTILLTGPHETDAFEILNRSQNITDNQYTISRALVYFCGQTSLKGQNIELSLFTADSHYRTYVLDTEGYIDVLDEEFCN